MQLIQELTLIQKAGAFIGVPLILLLLLVAARRRRATATAADHAITAGQPEGRRGRATAEPSVRRRKRRKLAAEAANSAGASAPVPPLVAAGPATLVGEPVAATEVAVATAPAASLVESPPPVPVAPAPADDPYVQDATFAEEQVATFAQRSHVAAPGWPTPGELASSFDPDAFDPLPAAAEAADEVLDGPVADDEPEEPTGIIEMPAPHHDETDEPEMARWDGEFDPATGWADDEIPIPVSVAAEAEDWYDSERPAHGGASSSDEPNPVELEQFWGDAEGEEPWVNSPEIEVVTEMSAANGADETVPAWVEDDEPAPWEAEHPGDISVPFPAPGSVPAHGAAAGGWTMAAPTQGSPVVLDLAGLAASGHSLELVIEASGDGNGVRLRFGSPSGAPEPAAQPETIAFEPAVVEKAAFEPAVVEEAEIDDLVEASEPIGELEIPIFDDDRAEPRHDERSDAIEYDVPFLTGGLPEPGVAHVAAAEPVPAVETPDVAAPAEVPHLAFDEDEPVFEAIHQEVDEVEPIEAAASPAGPEMDLSDDPVQILADIRARLAALDERR